MKISIHHYQTVTVLTLKEDLTGEEVGAFSTETARLLDHGKYHLLVDCTHSGGLDSAALEALLDVQSKCEERLGTVKLCGLDGTCSKILEITRLARRFEVFEDLESAVKSFG
jgi:anti-anti-sigma factor